MKGCTVVVGFWFSASARSACNGFFHFLFFFLSFLSIIFRCHTIHAKRNPFFALHLLAAFIRCFRMSLSSRSDSLPENLLDTLRLLPLLFYRSEQHLPFFSLLELGKGLDAGGPGSFDDTTNRRRVMCTILRPPVRLLCFFSLRRSGSDGCLLH
ncbi:uncharacterized protein K452DRAFT_71717 [Aplosporella prunicola CBS 121167]|uniref:Uncharacterized protein n=1 Tax=Aplosporella prunicola CBS 121167 TaxID=1176127 RepID=A0A6A6BRW7_9PEZI|nr:uncharacterized protein K452DRAFT_71717 [Aplosporella prunicola CBS 121167]KAF2146839.1 hypothetical protein K452DRAFT_71717 [Aplosporella prunicola CBS 121167]